MSARRSSRAGRLSYAALFGALLPAALVWWSVRLDLIVSLPMVGTMTGGLLSVAAGAALILAAIRDLWVRGRGLPMSAFPPERLVSSGTYRLVRDPIYLGAAMLSAGVAILTRSPAGLWIVTPVLILAMAAWVYGFERSLTLTRFGSLPTPILRLPPPGAERPSRQDVIATVLLVFGPWLVLYQAVEYLGPPAWAPIAYLPGEVRWPVIPWTEAIYAATYPLVLAAAIVAPTRSALRRFALSGLLATGLAVGWYLLLPVVAPAKPVPGEGFWQTVMHWERRHDSPATSLPAFHLVWTLLAARIYLMRWPRIRIVVGLTTVAIAVSCLTTGMHAVLDLAAAALLVGIVERREVIWHGIQRGTERLANSWREWAIGPVRIMNHGAWPAIGAMVGLAVAIWLAGSAFTTILLAMTGVAIVAAALWAQVVEGSSQLLRPFGYFGSVFGVVGVALLIEAQRGEGWFLLATFGTGAAFAQGIGRLRCLVQGCCHGRPAPAAVGIRYLHPRSRVVRLAALEGVPVHPTPLYSLLWLFVVGGVMIRLWFADAAPTFIVGAYFILAGLGRFVEEHFRGEPQTATYAGLRFYQWLAVLFVVAGAVITTLPESPMPPAGLPPLRSLGPLLLAGVSSWMAFGVDLPRASWRFSRLT